MIVAVKYVFRFVYSVFERIVGESLEGVYIVICYIDMVLFMQFVVILMSVHASHCP